MADVSGNGLLFAHYNTLTCGEENIQGTRDLERATPGSDTALVLKNGDLLFIDKGLRTGAGGTIMRYNDFPSVVTLEGGGLIRAASEIHKSKLIMALWNSSRVGDIEWR